MQSSTVGFRVEAGVAVEARDTLGSTSTGIPHFHAPLLRA